MDKHQISQLRKPGTELSRQQLDDLLDMATVSITRGAILPDDWAPIPTTITEDMFQTFRIAYHEEDLPLKEAIQKMLLVAPNPPTPDVMYFPICETQRVVLQPNRMYRFIVEEGCEHCKALADMYAGTGVDRTPTPVESFDEIYQRLAEQPTSEVDPDVVDFARMFYEEGRKGDHAQKS